MQSIKEGWGQCDPSEHVWIQDKSGEQLNLVMFQYQNKGDGVAVVNSHMYGSMTSQGKGVNLVMG